MFDASISNRSHFVMEFVPGTPITAHCGRRRLGIEQRLHLFGQARDATQHAHQKGIMHREPLVKVIDFGVAKAISQHLTRRTIYPEQGQTIGTPST